jgi:PAS domain S-box-containing protein
MNDFPAPQWLCEKIVEQSSIAIIVGDREGIMRLWNAGAESIFGWSAAEALGKSTSCCLRMPTGRSWA